MGKRGWKQRLAAGVVIATLAGGGIFAWRHLPTVQPGNCRVV